MDRISSARSGTLGFWQGAKPLQGQCAAGPPQRGLFRFQPHPACLRPGRPVVLMSSEIDAVAPAERYFVAADLCRTFRANERCIYRAVLEVAILEDYEKPKRLLGTAKQFLEV